MSEQSFDKHRGHLCGSPVSVPSSCQLGVHDDQIKALEACGMLQARPFATDEDGDASTRFEHLERTLMAI